MAPYKHFQPDFGDTTFTKVFVGGLAWETPTEEMRRYFEQFGEILEAVVITDKNTGKSKGYGFVTFRDADSAWRACANPNPMIDGRKGNCNIAALGRPLPPTPRRGSHGVSGSQFRGGAPQYNGVARQSPIPPSPPTAAVFYPTYRPDLHGYYQQALYYNQQLYQQEQYYQQMYGTSSTLPTMGSLYCYGYGGFASLQSPRGTFSAPHQRIYCPTHQLDQPFSSPTYPPPPSSSSSSSSSSSASAFQLTRRHLPSSSSPPTELQIPQHTKISGTEARVVTTAASSSPQAREEEAHN